MALTEGELIGNRWRLGQEIGRGQFCQVYDAEDLKGHCVAVKVEPLSTSVPTLPREISHLQWLHKSSLPAVGVPRLLHVGTYNSYNVMVTEKLGPSLSEMAKRQGGRLQLESVLMAGIQLLHCLEFTHHRSVLHCDITPRNILTGLHDSNSLYLIDYGLARQFRDHYTRMPIAIQEYGLSPGTIVFGSANGMEQLPMSRRDDLESLGYCLMFLYRGKLPWSSMNDRDVLELQRAVMDWKRAETSYLCEAMPREFVKYFKYVRSLMLEDRPDYSYLRRLFRDCIKRKGFRIDKIWDCVE